MRASESNVERNNIPLIEEILKLRAESSNLLGYNNYAERSLAAKMAPSVAAVRDLADLIAKKALPAALSELSEITDFAQSSGEKEIEKLMPWDIPFCKLLYTIEQVF